jgi:hypothetical protein
MIAATIDLVTYVWHYVLARMLYDQLARPLLRGRMSELLLVLAVAVTAFLVGRWHGSRIGRRESTRQTRGRNR